MFGKELRNYNATSDSRPAIGECSGSRDNNLTDFVWIGAGMLGEYRKVIDSYSFGPTFAANSKGQRLGFKFWIN